MTNIEAANLALYNKVGTCKARRVGAAGARYLLHLTVGSGNSAQNYRYGWLSGPYSWTPNWNSQWTPNEVTTNLETLGIQVKQSVASGLCGTLSFDYFSNDVTSLVNNSDVEFFMQNNTLKCRANGFAKQIRNPNNCGYEDVKTLLPPKVCKYLYQIKASKFNRSQTGPAVVVQPALSQLTQQVEAEIQKAEVLEASSIPIPQLTDVAEVLPADYFLPEETISIFERPGAGFTTFAGAQAFWNNLSNEDRKRIVELHKSIWNGIPNQRSFSARIQNKLALFQGNNAFTATLTHWLNPDTQVRYRSELSDNLLYLNGSNPGTLNTNTPNIFHLMELTRSNLQSLAPTAQHWIHHPYALTSQSINCVLQATQIVSPGL